MTGEMKNPVDRDAWPIHAAIVDLDEATYLEAVRFTIYWR